MKFINKYILIFFAVALVFPVTYLSVHSNEAVISKDFKNKLNFKKEFFLKDCLVKLDFNWLDNTGLEKKFEMITKIHEQVKELMVDEKIPAFSATSTRPFDNYIFMFGQACDERLMYVEKIVENYLEKNIVNFPKYRIKIGQIEDLKGAMPSGVWKDE